jgi:hypothetical protein
LPAAPAIPIATRTPARVICSGVMGNLAPWAFEE